MGVLGDEQRLEARVLRLACDVANIARQIGREERDTKMHPVPDPSDSVEHDDLADDVTRRQRTERIVDVVK